MNCPRCTEVFPSDEAFRQHAVSVHGAPQELMTGTLPTVTMQLPPGAQLLPSVDPTSFDASALPPVGESPEVHYTPVASSIHDRPRGTVVSDEKKKMSEEKKAITLVYKYDGNCSVCGSSVATSLVGIKGKTFALAYCGTCNEVQSSREVKPL